MALRDVLVLPALFATAIAFPNYAQRLPNGENVVVDGTEFPAIGHVRRTGGGRLNAFGEAFQDAGNQWNAQLCTADSDGDGLTNGEELGDPECVWQPGATPARSVDITHPGIAEGEEQANGGGGGGGGLQFSNLEGGGVATLLFIFGLGLVTFAGSLLAQAASPWLRQMFFYPGPKGLNLANLVGVSVVAMGLIAYVTGLSVAKTSYDAMVALGLASGLSMALPIWWAFSKTGVHKAFEMSREAAWRIHIVFGDIALIFALIHGAFAIREYGNLVFSQFGWICGLLGLCLILLGIAPAGAHALAPRLLTYDRWKMLHFLSLVGYVLTLVHMVDNALKAQTAKSVTVMMFNLLALFAYVVQFLGVKYEHKNAEIVEAVAIGEGDGKHVFLRLRSPGFNYVPGQWAYLRAPSISSVAHPFTIVPDTVADHVQFFIKVSGDFTMKLAQACLSEQKPTLQLQGPCGSPPAVAKHAQAVVFVLGGVGVTPSLSLVAEASKNRKSAVRMYWSVRSKELLHRCAPLLEPYLNLDLQCIRLTGRASPPTRPTLLGHTPVAAVQTTESNTSWPELDAVLDGIMKRDKVQLQTCVQKVKPNLQVRERPEERLTEENHPLGASTGRADVGNWLANVAADLSAEGVDEVLLFVCGPAQLVTSVKRATKETKAVDWHLHVEQFDFLPLPRFGKSKTPPKHVCLSQEP